MGANTRALCDPRLRDELAKRDIALVAPGAVAPLVNADVVGESVAKCR